jgi:hypothetical protein
MDRYFEASVEIEAPIEEAWAVLVDLASYPAWNTFCTKVESTLDVGSPIVLHVTLGGRPRVQRETVRAVHPNQRLCWGMSMGPALVFGGDRWQVLEPITKDRCRYWTHERFTGLLSFPISAVYGAAVKRGFETMAADLKKRVESLHPKVA